MTELDTSSRGAIKHILVWTLPSVPKRAFFGWWFVLYLILNCGAVTALSLIVPTWLYRTPTSSSTIISTRSRFNDDIAGIIRPSLEPIKKTSSYLHFGRKIQYIYATSHDEEVPQSDLFRDSNSGSNKLVNVTPPLQQSPSPFSSEKINSLVDNSLGDNDQKLAQWTDQLISGHLPGRIPKDEAAPWIQEVRFAMKAWARKRSKQGAVSIEMLLKRIIDERKAGNEYVQLSPSMGGP
jgi:hypothetical protein